MSRAGDQQALIKALSAQLTERDSAALISHLPRLEARLTHLRESFSSGVTHCVAVKSNPHPRLLALFVRLGFGLEAASIEELRRALQAGCPPARLVFDSPVKTRLELAEVAPMADLLVNVNCLEELERIPADARCLIGIRVNPLTHTGSPERFSVGQNESKFGVPISAREALIEACLQHPVRALHMHSGSQMRDLSAQRAALFKLGELAHQINERLKAARLDRRIELIDIGGGLPSEPLPLIEGSTSQMSRYGAMVHSVESLKAFQLVTEFGQWVNAEGGLALSRVEYVIKGQPDKLFIHLGADMFTRDAYTEPRPFPLSLWSAEGLQRGGELRAYDIAGPLCFAGDYIARGAQLPRAQEGDLLCVDHSGANCYALWSRHCSRALPAHWAWDGEALERWSPRREISY